MVKSLKTSTKGKSTAPKSKTLTGAARTASRKNIMKAQVSRIGSRNPYYRTKTRP